MAVSLRLVRFGRRNQASFRLRAADSRFAPTGRFIEELGSVHPLTDDPAKQVHLKKDRIEYWLKNGAKTTATVRSLLKKQGISIKAKKDAAAAKS
jgi:small subunit ribosomal protein S16